MTSGLSNTTVSQFLLQLINQCSIDPKEADSALERKILEKMGKTFKKLFWNKQQKDD